MINIQGISERTALIELMITRHCPYYCKHCMYDCGPKESKEYMSDKVLQKVKKQIDFLKELNAKPGINLVGGEPTINFEKFSHILSEVTTWNVPIQMTTNGWWLASQKNTERFFAIVSKYADKSGKSGFYETIAQQPFLIRVSDDPFHDEIRKKRHINTTLKDIFQNKKLLSKYNIPIPNSSDPWLWLQINYEVESGLNSYYIAPNGRGKNVTNIDGWLKRYSKDGNLCMNNLQRLENVHYEPDGKISDICGFGSIYDFGTVDDNIIFILELIWQYKKERWQNRENKHFTCSNCREMVQEWKVENLDKYREYFSSMNTMNMEKWLDSVMEK
jgi:hypothetical protein